MALIAAAISFLSLVLYCPAFLASSNDPKWFLFSVLIPLACLFVRFTPTRTHWIFLAWLGWAVVTLYWAVSFFDGLNRLWQFALLGGAFCVGSSLNRDGFGKCVAAFGLGIAVNAPIAGAQYFGLDTTPIFAGTLAPGLQINPNYLAEAAAICLVAAVFTRQWVWIPFCIACLVFAFSRGSIVGLVLALIVWLWGWDRRLSGVTLALTGLASVGYIALIGPASIELMPRWALWANSLASLSLAGYGIGSFWSAYP
ncbi:hypothetical protein LCGC14_2105440, partial [marine sediment metagenome]